MTDIFFDCANCRDKELKKLKEIDDKANEGKKLFGKQKTKIDTKIYRVKATEYTIISDSVTKDTYDSTEEHPRGIAGLKSKCSVCGETTFNYVNVGISDL